MVIIVIILTNRSYKCSFCFAGCILIINSSITIMLSDTSITSLIITVIMGGPEYWCRGRMTIMYYQLAGRLYHLLPNYYPGK
jgi:hypothetical protein